MQLISIIVLLILVLVSAKLIIDTLKLSKIKKEIDLYLPRPYKWTGAIVIVFSMFCQTLMFLYPNESVNDVTIIIFSVFVFLGIVITTSTTAWGIELPKKKPYFVYYSSFAKVHKVNYKDCIFYKQTNSTLILKTDKKTFYISKSSKNYISLIVKLVQFEVEEKTEKGHADLIISNKKLAVVLLSISLVGVFLLLTFCIIIKYPYEDINSAREILLLLLVMIPTILCYFYVKNWKIEIYYDRKYFLYRNSFGKIFIINYSDYLWVKQNFWGTTIKTKNKTIHIDSRIDEHDRLYNYFKKIDMERNT